MNRREILICWAANFGGRGRDNESNIAVHL